MSAHIHRDSFARGEYHRAVNSVPGQCHWCGQDRKRRFVYTWESDDRTDCSAGWRRLGHAFCNFSCYQSYTL